MSDAELAIWDGTWALETVWGDGMDGSGRNLLGLVLELVRARIR